VLTQYKKEEGMSKNMEEGKRLKVDFKKLEEVYKRVIKKGNFVIPAAVQDAKTKEVLILGYINRKALRYSFKNKVLALWSTSRNELWVKGISSGHTLKIIDILVNCEQNSFLFLVKSSAKRGSCHSKDKSGNFRTGCFYRRIKSINKLEFID